MDSVPDVASLPTSSDTSVAPRPTLRLVDTLLPLLLASLIPPALLSFLAAPWAGGHWDALVFGVAWLLTVAAVIVFVVPLMVVRPQLRAPSFMMAALWGALTGIGIQSLVFAITERSILRFFTAPATGGPVALLGLVSGLVYTAVVLLQQRRRRRASV